MLRKIHASGVESDEGFSIQRIRPELFEYKRGNKIIEFDLAYDPSKKKNYIYVSKEKSLSQLEKNKIINDIREAIKILKDDYEVI